MRAACSARTAAAPIDHFGMHGRVDIQVGTLSKAIGALGGYVAGKREPDRVPLSPRAAVPVLDLASAGGGRRVHRRARRADGGAGNHRTAVGEHAFLQRGAADARLQHRPERKPDHAGHRRRRGEGDEAVGSAVRARACSRRASRSRRWRATRPACARSSPRRTRARSCSSRSTPSQAVGRGDRPDLSIDERPRGAWHEDRSRAARTGSTRGRAILLATSPPKTCSGSSRTTRAKPTVLHPRPRRGPAREGAVVADACSLRVRQVFLAFTLKLSPARRALYLVALVLALIGFIKLYRGWSRSGAASARRSSTSRCSRRSGPTAPARCSSASSSINLLVLLEVADRLSLKGELEVAREIQLAMLPTRHLHGGRREICGVDAAGEHGRRRFLRHAAARATAA